MQHVETGEHAVSIWLSGEPLPSCRTAVAQLVQRVRKEAGLAPWPEVEADCFQSGESLLILARPAPPHRRSFYFSDLEDLLGAVFVCKPENGALYAFEAGYLLTLPPESVCFALFEYGRELPLCPDWEPHAREQGLCLLSSDAAGELTRVFSTDRI